MSSYIPSSSLPDNVPSIKTKTYSMGTISSAEDVKYHTKYKDLKRTVKEIEAENDKLHFEVLQAKRNIQRMKLERAILYERLSGQLRSSGSSDRQASSQSVSDAPLLPPSANPHSSQHRESRTAVNDSPFVNYVPPQNSLPHSRKETRPIPDAPMPGMSPVNSNVYPSRRGPASAHHESRQPLPSINSHLPPLPPLETRGRPPVHHSHSSSPREHRRSHSSSRSHSHQPPPISYQTPQRYADSLPASHSFHHSPTSDPLDDHMAGRKRMDYELIDRQRPQPAHTPNGPLSPRPRSSESRSTIHNHQRLGPGSYINREPPDSRDLEREREYERQREYEYEEMLQEREREKQRDNALSRERERQRSRVGRRDSGGPPPLPPQPHSQHSPPLQHPHASRYRSEYSEAAPPAQRHPSSRMREEPSYFHDMPGGGASYSRLTRSGTPGSGSPASGSGVVGSEHPSRPDSRDQPFSRDDRYRLRPVGTPGEDLDFASHEDGHGRSHVRDRGGGGGVGASYPPPLPPPLDGSTSRKRHRSDMEMDVDTAHDVGGNSPLYLPPHSDERGSTKRHHRELSHRGGDAQDDRMGP